MATGHDTEAIRRCQGGEIAGLEPLIFRYQVPALRLAYLLTGDRAAADDVVQDSFLQAYRHIGRFRAERPFGPWFYRIVTNTARQRMRRLRQRGETSLEALAGAQPVPAHDGGQVPDALRASGADPVERAERAEERDAVLAALAALTPKQREAVVLRYYFGCGDEEMADILGCRPGTARQRTHAGLVALEQLIRRCYPWLRTAHVSPPTSPFAQEAHPRVAPELR